MKSFWGKARIAAVLILGAATFAIIAMGASGDTTADRVLGAPDFTTYPNSPLGNPLGVAIDAGASPNRIYVADTSNNRVLGWKTVAFANGAAADLVIGQPDFTLPSGCNRGGTGVSADSLCLPNRVAVDGSGNLYVADAGNQRVLEYANPFAACGGAFPCVAGAAVASRKSGNVTPTREDEIDAEGGLSVHEVDAVALVGAQNQDANAK